jgi:Tfp pilus assembly protein PilV
MKSSRQGQSLIEIFIAIGVIVIGIAACASVMLLVEQQMEQTMRETQAASIAEEGLQATASIADRNWTELAVGTHGLLIGGTPIAWIFSGTSDANNGFARVVTVSSVDSNTKKVDVTVTWTPSAGRSASVQEQALFTNWATL